MRYFNTYGPVNEIEHYVVPRQSLVTELIAQIERGTYFTIFAPRQIGKTTLLRALSDILQSRNDYLALALNFEAYAGWTDAEFIQGFTLDFSNKLINLLRATQHNRADEAEQVITDSSPVDSFFKLQQLFLSLHRLISDRQLVLLVDEFDGTPREAIGPLLQMWRQIYLNSQPPRPIHSIALIGLQNIATLNLGRSSPFNIARQVRLHNFTVAQVQDLIGQYSAETGQAFDAAAIVELHNLTTGHPFLVNRLAAIWTRSCARLVAWSIRRCHQAMGGSTSLWFSKTSAISSRRRSGVGRPILTEAWSRCSST